MPVNLSDYIFTYSAKADSREIALADSLYKFLSETCGVGEYRTDADGFKLDVPEILFGRTKHDDSKYTNILIRKNRANYGRDFCIRFKLGKLIINAPEIEALEEAVDYFINLCTAEGLNVPGDYSYYHKTDLIDWAPAGITIAYYKLITPRAASYIYKNAVDDLREALRRETGALLPVWNDKMPLRRLELQIGETNRPADLPALKADTFEIGLLGERLYIRGESDLAAEAGIRELSGLLRRGERPELKEPIRGSYTPAGEDYRLVFADDFDGDDLDEKYWGKRLRTDAAHNGGTCYRTDRPENVFLRDSKLTIQGNRFGQRDFQSGYAWTKDKLYFKYGIIEIRAKLPHGQGIWPGFWLNSEGCGYEISPEIDILEVFGQNQDTGFNDTLHCCLHRWWKTEEGHGHSSIDGKGHKKSVSLPPGEEFSDDWHTIGMEWTPEKMIFFFDGSPYFEIGITEEENACFHQPVYIILSMAVGLTHVAPPNESNEWPAVYEIDRVHLYQRPGEGEIIRL